MEIKVPELTPFGRTKEVIEFDDEHFVLLKGTAGEGFVMNKENADREDIAKGRVLGNLVFVGA